MSAAACTYEPVLLLEQRKLTKHERKVRAVKVTGVVTLATLLVLVGLSGWVSPSGRADILQSRGEREVTEEFQLRSFPTDCPKLMKYGGCQKKAWSCEQDDGTMTWKCCCEKRIWKVPKVALNPGSSGSAGLTGTSGGARVLRLQTGDVCLGGPEGFGGSFQFAACGKSNTRFKLPQAGAGPIQFASRPGMCLSVRVEEPLSLVVASCSPGASEQMFQLTDGNEGMIQWSSGEPKCLDSMTGKTQAGSGIELTDCAYWPERPSQHFVLEVAPPEPDDKNKTVLDPPTLFCCSLMLPRTYEVGMLRSQLSHGMGVGIFACDEWAVYSNETVMLRDKADGKVAVYSDVMNGSLVAPIGGAFHTALNTPIFRRFWRRVIKDPKAWRNDWIVKLDPDCVFFPNRLKEMLKTHWKPNGTVEWASWLNNCQLGLHGPIEVFNKHALGVYNNNIDKCDKVAEAHGQEDVYMAHCLDAIGVGKVNAYNLLLESEWACNERPSAVELMPPCFSHQVAFHPFKSVKSYFLCYDKAMEMSWNTPLFMISDPPSSLNHHHT